MMEEEQFCSESAAPEAAAVAPGLMTGVDLAVSGVERIRERIRAHGDLQARLRELEGQLNEMKRSSMATPSIDPTALKSAFNKLEGRVRKQEELTEGLLQALTALNAKTGDLERLIAALARLGEA